MKLSVSILNSKDKINTIKLLNSSNISYFHLDVMDGIFVSQATLPYNEVIELSHLSTKPLDIHLMVEDPLPFINKIKDLHNIEYITIHLEIDKDIKYILTKIKSYGFKVGLAIKPNTDINLLLSYLPYIDLLLIMSVEPGYGGQDFLPSTTNRIEEIKKLTSPYQIELSVDGGINDKTITYVTPIHIAVVGSYITKSNDPINQIDNLQRLV